MLNANNIANVGGIFLKLNFIHFNKKQAVLVLISVSSIIFEGIYFFFLNVYMGVLLD